MGDIADQAQSLIEQQLAVSLSNIKPSINTTLPSAMCCDECDEDIPQERRAMLPGVRLCVGCASEKELHQRQYR